MNNKIVITVRDGIVESVFTADDSVEVVVIDYDVQGIPPECLHTFGPDLVNVFDMRSELRPGVVQQAQKLVD